MKYQDSSNKEHSSQRTVTSCLTLSYIYSQRYSIKFLLAHKPLLLYIMNAIRKKVTSKLFGSSNDIPDDAILIESPLESDILLGRSKCSWNHAGNRKFRTFVGLYLKQYIDTSNRVDKSMVVNHITQKVLEGGGRFLKINSDGLWCVVTPKMAREKVAHALRDAVGLRIKLSSTGATTNAKAKRQNHRRESNIMMECTSPTAPSIHPSTMQLTIPTIPSDTLQHVNKAWSSPSTGNELVKENGKDMQRISPFMMNTVPDILFTKELTEPFKYASGNLELLKTGSPSQLLRKELNHTDSGEMSTMSTMSTNQRVLTTIDGASGDFSMDETISLKKWTEISGGSDSFSVTSAIFDDTDTTMARMVQQVSKELRDKQPSKVDPHTSSLKKNLPRRSITETDISEEFSVLSLAEMKAVLLGDSRPRPTKVQSARNFFPRNTDIKMMLGWETEVSDELSSQGFSAQTRTSSKTTSSISDFSDDITNNTQGSVCKSSMHEPITLSAMSGDIFTGRGEQCLISELTELEQIVSQKESLTILDTNGNDKAIRNLSFSSSVLSDDFDISDEFGLSLAATHTIPSVRGVVRKKMLLVLSDVGEDDAEDSSEVASKPKPFLTSLK